MKLKDLLVQELPKRGGWPAAYNVISTNGYGQVWCYSINANGKTSGKELHLRSPEEGHVTREQYEAALAATQQPVWNGEGLPPVGVECEFYKHSFPTWAKGLIKYASDYTVVIVQAGHAGEIIGHPVNFEFRPIRTEEERKRDETLCAMRNCISNFNNTSVIHAIEQCYDAIAAGKIPGVRIE